MAFFYYIVISFVLNLFFLTLIVIEFIRFRKPESGPLLIAGFIGLAICVWFGVPSSYVFDYLVRDGIISFDNYVNLMSLSMQLIAVFMPAIILFILFILGIVKRDHKYSGKFMLYGGVGALIFFFLVAMALPSMIKLPAPATDAEVKANLHAIQNALERYAVDYSRVYPEQIETLIDDQYMAFFPGNLFIWQINDVPYDLSEYVDYRSHLPMKNVPYGSPDFEGNFTYLPVIMNDEVVGYYLIGYGYKKTTGERLISPDVEDHVIVVLDGPIAQPPDPFPGVQDVILESQSSELAGS